MKGAIPQGGTTEKRMDRIIGIIAMATPIIETRRKSLGFTALEMNGCELVWQFALSAMYVGVGPWYHPTSPGMAVGQVLGGPEGTSYITYQSVHEARARSLATHDVYKVAIDNTRRLLDADVKLYLWANERLAGDVPHFIARRLVRHWVSDTLLVLGAVEQGDRQRYPQ